MLCDDVFRNNQCRHVPTSFLHITLAVLAPKSHDLRSRPVHIARLLRAPRRLSFRQWAAMSIPTSVHFNNKRFMPSIQGLQLSLPSQRLWMMRITLLAIHDHRPDRMQLPMLPQQMIPAQSLWRDIPNSHRSSSVTSFCMMARVASRITRRLGSPHLPDFSSPLSSDRG